LLSIDLKKNLSGATLYAKQQTNDVLMVSVYVDDPLMTGNNAGMVQEFKTINDDGFLDDRSWVNDLLPWNGN